MAATPILWLACEASWTRELLCHVEGMDRTPSTSPREVKRRSLPCPQIHPRTPQLQPEQCNHSAWSSSSGEHRPSRIVMGLDCLALSKLSLSGVHYKRPQIVNR
jgi:hypothetical protein